MELRKEFKSFFHKKRKNKLFFNSNAVDNHVCSSAAWFLIIFILKADFHESTYIQVILNNNGS